MSKIPPPSLTFTIVGFYIYFLMHVHAYQKNDVISTKPDIVMR